MRIRKYLTFILFCILCLLVTNMTVIAAEQPMAKKCVPDLYYGYTSQKPFNGEVPALGHRVKDYDWMLFQWSACKANAR